MAGVWVPAWGFLVLSEWSFVCSLFLWIWGRRMHAADHKNLPFVLLWLIRDGWMVLRRTVLIRQRSIVCRQVGLQLVPLPQDRRHGCGSPAKWTGVSHDNASFFGCLIGVFQVGFLEGFVCDVWFVLRCPANERISFRIHIHKVSGTGNDPFDQGFLL